MSAWRRSFASPARVAPGSHLRAGCGAGALGAGRCSHQRSRQVEPAQVRRDHGTARTGPPRGRSPRHLGSHVSHLHRPLSDPHILLGLGPRPLHPGRAAGRSGYGDPGQEGNETDPHPADLAPPLHSTVHPGAWLSRGRGRWTPVWAGRGQAAFPSSPSPPPAFPRAPPPTSSPLRTPSPPCFHPPHTHRRWEPPTPSQKEHRGPRSWHRACVSQDSDVAPL